MPGDAGCAGRAFARLATLGVGMAALLFALGASAQTGSPVVDGRGAQVCQTAPGVSLCADGGEAVAPDEGSPAGPAGADGVEGAGAKTLRVDGVAAEESFGAQRLGGGVAGGADGATDSPEEASAGPGSGTRSVDDGGRRAGSAYVFSQAAVREFRVTAQGDAAEFGSAVYGHSVGGVVTSVTRSGEPELHGMALYTARSSVWAASDPFSIASTYNNGVVASAVVKPSDMRQQFAARLGGPIGRQIIGQPAWAGLASLLPASGREPRLFYLYAFDTSRRSFPAISAPGDPNFFDLTATQKALLANRGVSTAQTMAALDYLSSLTGEVDRRADQTNNFGRMDWKRTAGERWVAEYNRVRWSNPGGAKSGAVVARGRASLGSSYGSIDMGVLRWLRSPGPRFSTELRLQYGHELQYEVPQAALAQEPAVGPGGLPPEISIGPEGLLFGTPASLGQRAYPEESRAEGAAVATWVHGRHIVQFGLDLSAIRDYTDSLTNAEGTFSYDSGSTSGHAGGVVDWITDYTFNVHAYPNGGCPSIYASVHYFCFRSYSQSFGQQAVTFGTQNWAGFVQESWRAGDSLMIHAGVRYEYQLLPLPQKPSAALDATFGATGATSVFPEDRNNFGPRVGVEWRPLGGRAGTVRMGYGVYYGRVPGATIQAALLDTATASSVSRVRILPTTETVCPQMTTVGFGYPCSFVASPPGTVAASTSAVLFDRRFRLPMIQEGSLSVERNLPGRLLVRAGYVTNIDRQLTGSRDINIAPSTAQKAFALQGVGSYPGLVEGETFHVPVYTARVSPSFGTVTAVVSNSTATYNGMTVEAQRGFGAGREASGRVSPGLEFHLRWTWSKAIDFAPASGATPRANGQFDPFTNGYDKGLSTLNRPYRVSGSAEWSPRLERVAHMSGVAPVLRGWSVAMIGQEASGRPYSYEIFGGTRLTGGRETINGSGGSTVLPTVGRNTLRLPDTFSADLRLTREFRSKHEGVRLLASAEAFNVTNHVNVSGVQQRAFLLGTAVNGVTPLVFQNAAAIATEGLNVEPFGTYTSSAEGAGGSRQMEISLRLVF